MSQEPDDPAESIRMLTESAIAMVPTDGSLDHIRAARFTHPGFARDGWATLVEMGWLHLRISEGAGGLGLGRREAVALSRVLGGGLVPEPYLAALFALDLMEAAGCLDGIEPVLEGASIVVPAWQSSLNSMDPLVGVTVSEGRLTGEKVAVSAGADAFVAHHGTRRCPAAQKRPWPGHRIRGDA